jgi:hypothetical protein
MAERALHAMLSQIDPDPERALYSLSIRQLGDGIWRPLAPCAPEER